MSRPYVNLEYRPLGLPIEVFADFSFKLLALVQILMLKFVYINVYYLFIILANEDYHSKLLCNNVRLKRPATAPMIGSLIMTIIENAPHDDSSDMQYFTLIHQRAPLR